MTSLLCDQFTRLLGDGRGSREKMLADTEGAARRERLRKLKLSDFQVMMLEVLAYTMGSGVMTAAGIARRNGELAATVSRSCEALVKKGLVGRAGGGGAYRITLAGQQALTDLESQ